MKQKRKMMALAVAFALTLSAPAAEYQVLAAEEDFCAEVQELPEEPADVISVEQNAEEETAEADIFADEPDGQADMAGTEAEEDFAESVSDAEDSEETDSEETDSGEDSTDEGDSDEGDSDAEDSDDEDPDSYKTLKAGQDTAKTLKENAVSKCHLEKNGVAYYVFTPGKSARYCINGFLPVNVNVSVWYLQGGSAEEPVYFNGWYNNDFLGVYAELKAGKTYLLRVSSLNEKNAQDVSLLIKHECTSDNKKTTPATVFAPQTVSYTCKVCGKKVTDTYGTKLTPTIKLSTSSLKMQQNQSTSAFKISGLANGDYVKSVTSSNKSVVKVLSCTPKGAVKLKAQKKIDKAVLTVKLASGLTRKVNVSVQKAAVKTTKVKISVKTLSLKKGKKAALSVTLTPVTSTEKVTYTSSNSKVASVSSKGVVTAVKKGTAKITVKSGSKTAVVTVKVAG